MHKLLVRGVVVCVAALIGVTTLAAPANASTYRRQYHNVNTRLCLDNTGGRTVRANGCNSGNYQRWDTFNVSGGWQFKNVATQYCLDSNSNGSVYTSPCNSANKYQVWRITNINSNTQKFTDYNTGLVLDSNSSGDVYTRKANSGSYQEWSH